MEISVEEKPELSAAQKEKRIQEAFIDVLKEAKRLAEDPERSEALFDLEVQRLVDYSKSLGQETESLRAFFDQQRQQWAGEIRSFTDIYRAYKIDAFFALKLSDAVDAVRAGKEAVSKKKEAAKLKAAILEKLPKNAQNLNIVSYVPATNADRGGYIEKSALEVTFEMNGVPVRLKGNDVIIRDYGSCLIMQELYLDSVRIGILDKTVFDLRVRQIKDIAGDFKQLSAEQKKGKLIYSPHLNRILLPQDADQSQNPVKFPTYLENGDQSVVVSVNGRKLYQRDRKEGMLRYQVFMKDGPLMPTYDEFLAARQDKQGAPEAFTRMLAENCDTDEALNVYMQVMFTYTNDMPDAQTATSTAPGGNQFPVSFDSWQPWEKTLARLSAAGQHLGDCEDYSFFLKKILELQGKNPQVLLIPAHATVIWAEKTKDGYVMRDASTFPLIAVEDKSLEGAYQKVLDRYTETGLGVWAGGVLSANRHNVSIGGIQAHPGEKMIHVKMFALPLEALTDPDLARDFVAFQEHLHEALRTKKGAPEARREFEALKKKYGNNVCEKWFGKKEDFPVLSLYEAVIAELEGNKTSVSRFIDDYVKNSKTVTQDTFDMLIPYARGREHVVEVLQKMRTLKHVTFNLPFQGLLLNLSPTSIKGGLILDEEAVTALKDIADSKMTQEDRIQVYNYFLQNSDYIDAKSRDEVVDFVFSQSSPAAFAPDDIRGYERFSRFFDHKTRVLPPEKQAAFCLKALKAAPQDQFFQIQLLKALVKAAKFAALDYLMTANETIGRLYADFDSHPFGTRSYLVYIKLKTLMGLERTKDAFDEIADHGLANMYSKGSLDRDISFQFEMQKLAVEILSLFPAGARELLQKETERQLQLRSSSNKKALEENNRVIPLANLLILRLKYETDNDQYQGAIDFCESVLHNPAVNIFVQYKMFIGFGYDLAYEQTKTGSEPFQSAASYFLKTIDAVKDQRIAAGQKKEPSLWFDHQDNAAPQVIEQDVTMLKEKLAILLHDSQVQ